MYKICIYCPENAIEKIKHALFDIGAGKIGDYDSCCWQSTGIGQFRALKGAHPTLGEKNKLERVNEVKIEMVCNNAIVKQIVNVIKQNHPYEEPAYAIWKIEDL